MARGGARIGAGRPKGTGKYGEKTTTVRIPVRLVQQVREFIENCIHPPAQEQEGVRAPITLSKTQTNHAVRAKVQETV